MTGPAAAPALLLPLRDARPPQPGRALPDGAAARLQGARPLRLLLLRGLHARLLQRVRAAGGRGPRLRRLPRRLHLRRDLRRRRRRPRDPRRPDRPPAGLLPLDRCARRRRCRSTARKYALYRTDAALRKLHAAFPVVATWDDHEVSEQLRQRRAGRRAAAARGLLARPARRRLPGVLRVDAGVPARPLADLPHAGARADGRPDDARRAPVPGRPAVRRRDRAPVRQLEPAAVAPRPPPARVPGGAAEQLQGRLEGRRRPVADDAQPRPRRASTSASTPGRATRRSASTCSSTSSRRGSRTSSSSPATSTR